MLLIQKYSPKNINDFELEENLINCLYNIINIDSLNILLITNTGCGKTSLINVIIKEYFKNIQNFKNNILYINTIKEQGISYYRNEVKTFCQTLSTIPNKKKIVVLDDIDLINEQSQQVFRNCIDKYSKNVHFIASCTNPQKVIINIQSRLTSIKISPLSNNKMENILNKIITNENIILDEQSKNFILINSDNSVRTLINYLEKIKLLNNNNSFDIIKKICTDISYDDLIEYINLCKNKELVKSIDVLYNFYNKGYSVMDILDNLFNFIKRFDCLSQDQFYKVIPLLCKYIFIFNDIHEDPIELAFFTNNLIKIF